MVWTDYPRKPATEWEHYWMVRCGWLEEQLERAVAIFTEEQRKLFDVRRFEWSKER